MGYINEDEFIKVATNSLNPDKQYYTLLERYKQGKKRLCHYEQTCYGGPKLWRCRNRPCHSQGLH